MDRDAARKGNPDEWFPGERETVITAPVTRARGKERSGSPESPPRGLGQSVAKGKDNRRERGRDGSSESPPSGQSQEVASGKSSRETTASFSESEGEDGVDDGDEWTESGDQDFDENLTYHEDSLSVFRGCVSTPLGEDVPVYTTTDSGSMTQLMQRQFAVRLKLKRRKIPEGRTFHINSPGGGSDEVSEYVILHVKILCKKETIAEQGFEECESEAQERVIKMKFGLCEQLPVPVLWGCGDRCVDRCMINDVLCHLLCCAQEITFDRFSSEDCYVLLYAGGQEEEGMLVCTWVLCVKLAQQGRRSHPPCVLCVVCCIRQSKCSIA